MQVRHDRGRVGRMLNSASDGIARVLVAAGGTGGHLFPAEALAAVLAKRGIKVELATDHRAERYSGIVSAPCMSSRARRSAAAIRFRLRRPQRARLRRRQGLAASCRRSSPSIVVGFGGYPSIPPVLAASLRGIPTLIHEQNAVMGRANRFLAARVTRDRHRLSPACSTRTRRSPPRRRTPAIRCGRW